MNKKEIEQKLEERIKVEFTLYLSLEIGGRRYSITGRGYSLNEAKEEFVKNFYNLCTEKCIETRYGEDEDFPTFDDCLTREPLLYCEDPTVAIGVYDQESKLLPEPRYDFTLSSAEEFNVNKTISLYLENDCYEWTKNDYLQELEEE